MTPRPPLLLLLLVGLVDPGAALGQVDRAKTGSAIGEALFREAQELTRAGKHAEACEKFAASQKADPSIGTLLNLAVCHERIGRTASAWTGFAEVASLAATAGNQRERLALARARMKALEPRLLRGTVEVPLPVPGLEVSIDDSPLPQVAWGRPIPLDPGDHRVAAQAPGHQPWSGVFTVAPRPAENRTRIPALDAEVLPPPPAPPNRVALLATGSTGLALGAGSLISCVALGLRAKDLAAERDARCPPQHPCIDPAAYQADRSARVHEQASIITGAAGTAAVGVGLTLLLLGLPDSPSAAEETSVQVVPAVGPGGWGLAILGTF